jgi:hypothetical protein
MTRSAKENIQTQEGRSWRRLHNKELLNLYASLGIIRVSKSRRMRWAGQ